MTAPSLRMQSLRSITRGAMLFVGGLAVMNLMGFLVNLALTRAVGVERYGIYAYTITVVGMLLMVTNLGADTSLLKYLPEFEGDRARQESILGLAYLTSIAGGLGAGACLYLAAPTLNARTFGDPLFADVLRLFAIVVALSSVGRIIHRTFRSLELLEYEIFVTRLVRPTLNLGCIGLALLLGLSFYGVMAALVLASALGLGIGVYVLWTRIPLRPAVPRAADSAGEVLAYYKFSIPLTFTGGSRFLNNRVDILVVGVLLSSTAVGIYNIALLFASALIVPLVAVNQLFPPVASRLHADGRSGALNDVYGTVTRWTFTVALLLGVFVVTYRRELLAIFGAEFVAGGGVLALVLAGQLVNSATGPSNHLLVMTGHQYVALANKLVFGALNVALNYAFILAFGLLGAGIATCFVLVIYNLTKLGEIWYLERLQPFSLGFLKALVAAVGGGGAMDLVGHWLEGSALLALGGLAGACTYASILYLAGFETDDVYFFRSFLAEHRAIPAWTPKAE